MKMIKKLIYINSFLIILVLFGSQAALARTDFEIELDFDADGICGSSVSDHPYYLGPTYFCSPFNGEADNCPDGANSDQADGDSDGVGDACDQPKDSDQDGIPDCSGGEPMDLCPPPAADFTCEDDTVIPINLLPPPGNTSPFPCNTSRLTQIDDLDGDGAGDACDSDVDDDGVANGEDCNCIDADVLGPPAGSQCSVPDPNTGDTPLTSGGCSLVSHGKAGTAVSLTTLFLLSTVLALGVRIKRSL
ncbi:MAG: thrombospondin type 3 repeat-containing protein [Actinomycetota bacterium]